jgi:hypothetical protein
VIPTCRHGFRWSEVWLFFAFRPERVNDFDTATLGVVTGLSLAMINQGQEVNDGYTRHWSLTTMRGYVPWAKRGTSSSSGKGGW